MIPSWMRRIAKERILILFRLASKEIRSRPDRSQRYVELARKISMKYKVRMSEKLQRSFCKKCFSFWKQGISVSTRLDSKTKRAVYTCGFCGAQRTFSYSKKTAKSL